MFSFSVPVSRTLILAAAVPLALGCSDVTGAHGRGNVALSFTAAPARASLASVVPLVSARDTVELQQVQLTLRKVELERSASDGREDDTAELSLGPLVVDLPLAGGQTAALAVPVPAGRYEKLDATVSSVRLRGTHNGRAFDVTVPVDAEIEQEFRSPLSVADGAPVNVTVRVDPSVWLHNADGSLLDPSTAASDATVRATLRSRIAASFEAFEDDDHDGRDDG